MAEWRIGRGWSDAELAARLETLDDRARNFSGPLDWEQPGPDWFRYFSEAAVARCRPGPPVPDGPFEQGCTAVARYEFSDPRIVRAHMPPEGPLEGRRFLLELVAIRTIHFLGAVVVGAVQRETREHESVFGFRYDTLEGHIERGSEWFILTKDHASGVIRFRIQAVWQPGQFPNWWSRAGFALLGPLYQRIWHERAHDLLSRRIHDPALEDIPLDGERVVHSPPDVIFKRFNSAHDQ